MNKTVLILSPMGDFVGGAVRSMYQVVLNLKKNGYNPIVILPGPGTISDQLKLDHIKTEFVSFDWWIRGAEGSDDFDSGMLANSKAVTKLINIINREDPLVCMTYTIDMPWLAYAADICKVPHICQVCEDVEDKKWRTRLPVRDTIAIIDGLSDKLFANSEFIKDSLSRSVDKNTNISVVYPYVDQKAVGRQSKQALPDAHIKRGDFRVSLVGAIMPAKGQFDAVQAVGKLTKAGVEVSLWLVGGIEDQNYFNKIKKYVQEHDLTDKVSFIGEVDNPHIYTRNSDLSLVCSENEPFGRVTIESMSLGVPVIGSNNGGTKEIIGTSGEHGLLYKAGSHVSLAEKIEFVRNNPQKAQAMAEKAQAYVSKFTLDKCQKPLFSYLASLKRQSANPAVKLYANDLASVVGGAINSAEKELNFHKRVAEERLQETRAVQRQLDAVKGSNSYKIGKTILTPLRLTKSKVKKNT